MCGFSQKSDVFISDGHVFLTVGPLKDVVLGKFHHDRFTAGFRHLNRMVMSRLARLPAGSCCYPQGTQGPEW